MSCLAACSSPCVHSCHNACQCMSDWPDLLRACSCSSAFSASTASNVSCIVCRACDCCSSFACTFLISLSDVVSSSSCCIACLSAACVSDSEPSSAICCVVAASLLLMLSSSSDLCLTCKGPKVSSIVSLQTCSLACGILGSRVGLSGLCALDAWIQTSING